MTMTLEHHHAQLADVSLHYVTAGAGDPGRAGARLAVDLVRVAPRHGAARAAHHRLIVPDLRGLGDSSRPRDGYDKKTVAADLWQLLSGELGLTRWHLVGHDWGGPVAFALAAAHADAIRTLSIVDVTCPASAPTSRKAASAGTTPST
jgi:pimeloyl-ACP methyl ester carboxylesterase